MSLSNNLLDRIKSVFGLTSGGLPAIRTIVEGITVNAPGLEVELDHTDGDSVQIGDGVDALKFTASGDADQGNPLKVGGRYDATLPTHVDGDRADLQTDSRGRLITREACTSLAASFTSAGQFLQVDTVGATSMQFFCDNTFVGLISVHGSADGVNYRIIPIFDYTSKTAQDFVGAPGSIFAANVGGFCDVRIVATTLTSGQCDVTANLNAGVGPHQVYNQQPGGFRVAAQLTDWDYLPVRLGQKPMATSLPVTIASDQPPIQVESQDILGSTTHINGTVGTTPESIPATPTTAISSALVSCSGDNSTDKELHVSFDGGVGFIILTPGDSVSWDIRGEETQVVIKGNVVGVDYESIINREPV